MTSLQLTNFYCNFSGEDSLLSEEKRWTLVASTSHHCCFSTSVEWSEVLAKFAYSRFHWDGPLRRPPLYICSKSCIEPVNPTVNVHFYFSWDVKLSWNMNEDGVNIYSCMVRILRSTTFIIYSNRSIFTRVKLLLFAIVVGSNNEVFLYHPTHIMCFNVFLHCLRLSMDVVLFSWCLRLRYENFYFKSSRTKQLCLTLLSFR